MSTRGGDSLDYKIVNALGRLRDELATYLDDVDCGWYDMLTKDDFIMRVRMALDDLDESELGAMYDEYVKDADDSDDDD